MEEKRKDPKEKKCAICGKDMYAGEDWAYKRRIGGERTKWFCSYKCLRAWDAKTEPKQKRPAGLPENPETAAPKEPVSRAVLAKALAKEIRAGRSVIEYMKAEGYKNPWEAYNAVRHYCETKMPELAEVLKPLRELQKAPAKTGRPKKPTTVEKVEEVPPVQCIAHVTAAELEEAQTVEEQDRKIVLKPENIQDTGEIDLKQLFRLYSRENILLLVDKAALDCQKDQRLIMMSSSGVKAAMLQNATVAAENVGIMKLRKQIRKMLGADEEE